MKKRGSQLSSPPSTIEAVRRYCRTQAAPMGSCRHYASAYLSPSKRAGLFALYALDNAIFSIPFLVSDPDVAKAKLQWWHHAITDLFAKKNSEHPILRALLPYLATPGWEVTLFTTYIDHTQRWLEFDIFQTQMEYLQHIHHTSGQIGQLALLLCTTPSEKARQFANHFATITDTVHFICTLDRYLQHHKVPFSLELLDRLAIPADRLHKQADPSTRITLIDHQLASIQSHRQATQTLYDPKGHPNLRYFRIMMQLKTATLQHYRHCLLKARGNEKPSSLMPVMKYWMALRAR